MAWSSPAWSSRRLKRSHARFVEKPLSFKNQKIFASSTRDVIELSFLVGDLSALFVSLRDFFALIHLYPQGIIKIIFHFESFAFAEYVIFPAAFK